MDAPAFLPSAHKVLARLLADGALPACYKGRDVTMRHAYLGDDPSNLQHHLLADAETLERLEQLRGLPPSISDVRFQLDPTVGLIGAGNIGNGLLLLLESANDEFAVPIQRDTTQEALPWRYNRLLCSTAIQDEAWHEEIEAALRSAPAKELIDSAEDFWAGVRDDGSAGAPAADEDKADDKEYWERYDQVEPVVGEPSADKRAAALLQTLQGVWALYRSQAHPQDDEAAAREFLACAQEAIKL